MTHLFGDPHWVLAGGYRPLPTGGNFGYDISDLSDPSLTPGEPYRPPYFTQLR